MYRSSRSDIWKSGFWPRKSGTATSPTSLRHEADVIGHWIVVERDLLLFLERLVLFLRKSTNGNVCFWTFSYSPVRLKQTTGGTTGATPVTIYWCGTGAGDILAVTVLE